MDARTTTVDPNYVWIHRSEKEHHFATLVSDGSCGCPVEGGLFPSFPPVLIDPIDMATLRCSKCLKAVPEAWVKPTQWPVAIMIGNVNMAAEHLIREGNGRALGIAGLLGLDKGIRTVHCACGCLRLEVIEAGKVG